MYLAYKYRLYPTRAQAQFLDGQRREASRLYNAAKQERDEAWKRCGKGVNYYDQANQLREIRAAGNLGLANFSCCQEVLRRVDRTYRAFYARVRRGEKAGFPRYRSARRYNSLTFPSYGDGCHLRNAKLYLQGAGNVKVKVHRPLEGLIKTVTVRRDAGRWYACFGCEVEAHPLPASTRQVGVDLGLESFAVLSDGTEVDNPRQFSQAQARLRRAQRKVARRQKGSCRRRKAVGELQRVHAHVRNQRADFHHRLAYWLVSLYGLIAVEDLNIKGLAGGMLAKSVHDAAWAQFLAFLTYKAASAGRELVKVDPRGTSQTCWCGACVPKTLEERWHTCPACGLSAPRDLVSAQLLLLRARIGPSRLNVEDAVSCVPREAVPFQATE